MIRVSDLWRDTPAENNILLNSTSEDVPDVVHGEISQIRNFLRIEYATISAMSIWETNNMIREYVAEEKMSRRLEAKFLEMARALHPELRKEAEDSGGP